MLFPWEAEGLGQEEARIVEETANALLDFMVAQSAAAIAQGDDYSHLFDESLNVFQRAMQMVSSKSRILTGVITHNTRVSLAKATDNDLRRINKTLGDLPASFRGNLHRGAAATAQGIIDIVRRDNLSMTTQARSAWYSATSRAISAVNTGALGYEEAVRRATLELADKGIQCIDYSSGIKSDVDVAVRRHVMTQIKQAGAQRTMELCETLGVELVEVSRSGHPRPSHARWEGKIYRIVDTRTDYPDFWEGTGYEGLRGPYVRLGDRLEGVNCKHDFAPYDEALDPMWDEELFPPDETERRYELSQEQRALERQVRKAKRAAHLLEVAGQPNVRERAKIGNYQRQLRELVANNPDVLQREYARERLNGYRDQETGREIQQPAPLGKEPLSRTAFLNKPESQQAIKRAGVSKSRISELLKAFTSDFYGLTAQAQQQAFLEVIRQAVNEKFIQEAKKKIESGELPLTVNEDKQRPHNYGTETNRGTLAEGVDAQALICEFYKEGILHVSNSGKQVKVVCTTKNRRKIGTWRSQDGEHESDTDRFTIHFSATGTHVVPSKPSWLLGDILGS